MNTSPLVQGFRRWRLAREGLRLHRTCLVDTQVQVGARTQGGRLRVGAHSQLELGVQLNTWGGEIELGENVFIGPYTVVYGHGGVVVGAHTLVSMHCRILSSNHTVPPMGTLIRSQPDRLLPTRIGRDVWLGAGVTVLGGAVIGDGCVVGAGAVVTGELPAGAIAVGVPARVVDWRAGATPSGAERT